MQSVRTSDKGRPAIAIDPMFLEVKLPRRGVNGVARVIGVSSPSVRRRAVTSISVITHPPTDGNLFDKNSPSHLFCVEVGSCTRLYLSPDGAQQLGGCLAEQVNHNSIQWTLAACRGHLGCAFVVQTTETNNDPFASLVFSEYAVTVRLSFRGFHPLGENLSKAANIVL